MTQEFLALFLKLSFGAAALAIGFAIAATSLTVSPVEVRADWELPIQSTNPSREVNTGTDRYWFAARASSGIWTDGAVLGVYIWGTNYAAKAYQLSSYGNNTGTELDTLYCIDIPKAATEVILLRLPGGNSSTKKVWNQSDDLHVSDLSKTALNVWTFSNSKLVNTPEAYVGASAYMLSSLLEDFPTCNTSAADIQSLYTNFWSQKWDNNNNGKVSEVQLGADFDYAAYVANGKDYKNMTTTTATTRPTVQQKWDALCAHAGVNPSTGKAQNTLALSAKDNVGPGITVGLAGFGLAAAGAMIIFARKRKEI